jgi:hypothetical protein
MKEELEELNQIWSKARIFRRFISRPGSLKITVPTPDGMAVISWKVEKVNQYLGNMIRCLHAHLGLTMGVIMSFDNAVSLRDAIVQARAEGKGVGQLRARLLVRKEGESLAAYPYVKKVSHNEREEDVKEYLDYLDELTGGSFTAEAIERRDSKSVAIQGLITVRATFVEETELPEL